MQETCACKCKFDASVFNDTQRWNSDKCRYECKELTDKGRCDDGFAWNPSVCEYEYNESFDVGEYLDYANCKCRRMLIDKLVQKCDKNIDGNKMVYNTTLNDYERASESCTLHIILLIKTFIIITSIGIACIYFYWHIIKNCFNKLPY